MKKTSYAAPWPLGETPPAVLLTPLVIRTFPSITQRFAGARRVNLASGKTADPGELSVNAQLAFGQHVGHQVRRADHDALSVPVVRPAGSWDRGAWVVHRPTLHTEPARRFRTPPPMYQGPVLSSVSCRTPCRSLQHSSRRWH